jgi:hypothetical protein
MERAFNQMSDWQWLMIIGAAILVILILVVLATFLGTMGRIGLTRGTVQAEQGKEKLAFGELFSGSLPYFWRIFLLYLLVGLAVFLVILALILSICLSPLVCLMIPVAWVVNIVLEQASVAIIVEDLGLTDGLKRGWEIVRLNAGTMAIMWLVLVLGIGLIGGLIIALPLMLSLGPVIAAVIAGGEDAVWGGLAVAAICFVAWLPFLIVLGGIMRSYIGSAWTLTFLRLTATPKAGDQPEPLPEAI